MVTQFDYTKDVINGYGILSAKHFSDDVIFNESYIVFGEFASDGNIHACYDLTVFGSISAKKITVNGSLRVFGSITSDYVQVQKDIFCNANINVKELNGYDNIFAKAVNSAQIFCGNKMLVNETINIDELCEVDNIMVACEGIIGRGSLKVKNAVANDYFEFIGTVQGNVFEIYEMESNMKIPENISIVREQKALDDYAYDCRKSYGEVQKQISNIALIEDEEQLISALEKLTFDKASFNNIYEQFKLIIDYSYRNEIDNIYDYLIIAKSDNELPAALKKYETVSGVFDVIFRNAKVKLSELNFAVNSSTQFAEAIHIAAKYKEYLAGDYDFIMDAIFSSIGIKYNTVRKVLSEV
jgi:hypothetical protein